MEQDTERGRFVSKHPMLHSLYLKIWTSQPQPLFTQNPLLPDQYTTKQNNGIGQSRLKFFINFFLCHPTPFFYLWLGHQHPTSNAQNSVHASVCVDHRGKPRINVLEQAMEEGLCVSVCMVCVWVHV